MMGRNFAAGPNWLPGIVVECEGKAMAKMKLDNKLGVVMLIMLLVSIETAVIHKHHQYQQRWIH